MRRSRAHLVMRVVATVIIAVSLVVPAQAFAALEDDPNAKSTTNPNWPNGEEIWWRDGWGNSLYPNITFASTPFDPAPNGQAIETLGLYYWVTRGSEPDTQTIPPLNASIDPQGSMGDQTFDLAGLYADPVLGLQSTGSIEGTWTVYIAFYNRYRVSTQLYAYGLNYDGTPPSAVSALTAAASSGAAAATGWTETSRRYVSWLPAIDALSGVGVYKYELNGKFVAYHPGPLLGQPMVFPMFTIDTLPAGRNAITITPIDRATNAGPSSTVYAYVDPDVPVVKMTAPTAQVVGVKPTIKATATDAAGIRSVKFYVNNNLVYTDTAAPFEATPSLSGYTHGSWLNLKVVAEDMFGHKATATKSAKLDKVAPSIGSVSDTPDPFYPIIREGYKDNAKVKFTLGEKATVYLRVYNSSGKMIREIKTTMDRGTRAIKWNGKNSGGTAKTGTFYLKLVARDAAGNVRSTKKFATHIKNYEIVRVSRSAVRVIPR